MGKVSTLKVDLSRKLPPRPAGDKPQFGWRIRRHKRIISRPVQQFLQFLAADALGVAVIHRVGRRDGIVECVVYTEKETTQPVGRHRMVITGVAFILLETVVGRVVGIAGGGEE